MSQQVNLLNPRLQRKRDALSLNAVALAVLVVVLIEGALTAYAMVRHRMLTQEESVLQAQSKNLRLEIEATQKLLAERKPNPALAAELGRFQATLGPREEALSKLRSMETEDRFYANVMQGFARQAMEGVWLTEFSASAGDLSIKGRLTDSALLPTYVRRLNEEPAFRGRRFLALDMKGVEPAPEKDAATAVQPTTARSVVRVPAYVEFALQGVLPAAPAATATKSGGGQG